jgi:hypothetical protein
MRTLSILVMLLGTITFARAEDAAPSRIDSITKSARDMMPAMPAMPSVSLPSMPDLSLPDFSDATGRVMSEFNIFTQQVGDALPILEQMGYEVTVFKVTWGLPPKARLPAPVASAKSAGGDLVLTIANLGSGLSSQMSASPWVFAATILIASSAKTPLSGTVHGQLNLRPSIARLKTQAENLSQHPAHKLTETNAL